MEKGQHPQQPPDWPASLMLLTTLLGKNREDAGRLAPGLGASDWSVFRDLAVERHRVAPMIAASLSSADLEVPESIAGDIRTAARQCGAAALAQRAEMPRALRLKGWPLAEWLYGGIGLRHASDIDLLVAPEDRAAAARCLAEAGYAAEPGHGLRSRLIAHPAVGTECKDLEFRHAQTGMRVELHWRTNHFRSWPGVDALGEPPVVVTDGPSPIHMLGPLGQLIYLSAHGQQHLFGRLKWLLDIARLSEKRGVERLASDLRRATELGAGVPARLALHLVGAIFGSSVPPEAERLVPREAAWAGEITKTIADPRLAPGLLETRIAFYRWHWRMAEGRRQRLGVLRDAVWRRLRLGAVGLVSPGAAR